MAQLAVAAVGALALGPVGLGLTTAGTGFMLGSLAYSLMAPGQKSYGPRLNDLKITGTDYGACIPWLAGSPRVAGQVVWASARRETAKTESQGKGGGGGPSYTSYTYDVDLLILLSENAITGISRVWSNGELVYSNGRAQSGVWADLRVYTGADDQLPDPTYEAAVGLGNAPALRGMGSVMIQGLQLGSNGNIPNLTFEVRQELLTVVASEHGSVSNGGTAFWSHGDSYDAATGRYYFYLGTATSVTTSNFVTCDLTYVSAASHVATVGGEFQYAIAGTAFFGASIPVTNAWSSHIVHSHTLGRPARVMLNTSAALRSYLATPAGASGDMIRGSLLGSVGVVTYGDSSLYLYPLSDNGTLDPDTTAIAHASSYSIGAGHQIVSSFGISQDGGDYFYVLSIAAGAAYITKLEVSGTAVVGMVYQQSVAVDGVIVPAKCAIVPCNSDYFLAVVPAGSGNSVIRVSLDGGAQLLAAYAGTTGLGGNRPSLFVSNGASEVVELYAHSTDMTVAHSYGVRSLRVTSSGLQENPPLLDVVTDLMYRAGHQTQDFDVQVPASVVRSLALSQVASTRSALEVLQQAYFMEVSADEQIRFRPRAVTPVASIPFADLGMGSDMGGDDEPFALTLGNDLELPAQLALSYPNMSGDYQTATEYSDRLLSGQQSTETISTAVGMVPAEAKAVVDGLLMDRVASLATATIKLPLKYARLEPGDVITVTDRDGRSYRLRIVSKKDTLPILEFQCVLDDVGSIDSAAITDDGYIDSSTVIQPAGTALRAMDIPILRDADDAPGYYVAVAPVRVAESDKWPGALIAQSWNGTDYEQLLTSTGEAVMGAASTALGAWTGGAVFDEASTVTVQVSGELASSTRDAMLLDETINALLLGQEVLRFRNAALVSEGVYLLSGLLRGQRGTEWAMGTHAVGERVVLLGNALRRVASQTSELGLVRQLKAVTLGTFLSAGVAQDFTDTGIALKPFSPANPRALAASGDITVTWQRRTRVSYQYSGLAPVVPLGEAVEAYRVRVLSGATVLRTATVSAPVYVYTAALQAADGVATGTALTFEICQLSATVGAGYPVTVGATAP